MKKFSVYYWFRVLFKHTTAIASTSVCVILWCFSSMWILVLVYTHCQPASQPSFATRNRLSFFKHNNETRTVTIVVKCGIKEVHVLKGEREQENQTSRVLQGCIEKNTRTVWSLHKLHIFINEKWLFLRIVRKTKNTPTGLSGSEFSISKETNGE